MEDLILKKVQNPVEKLYEDRQVWVGSMLGGPMAAGYFVAQNFRRLGESQKAKISVIVGFLVTVFVFGIGFVVPIPDKFPNMAFPLAYTVAAYVIVKTYQSERISKHIESGRQIESWWKTIGISIGILLLTVVPIMGLGFLTLPAEISKTFGKTNNEITYQEGNISENEVDAIAEATKTTWFFGDESKGYLYVVKSGNEYQLSINFTSAGQMDSKTVENFRLLRNDIQEFFPNYKIVINLTVDTLDNVIKRLE